jgi:MYXO-CTERM domain-containing protein
MTKDPMFYENPDLPDVAQTQIAQQMVLCNGDSVYTLPDGREVYVPAGTGWPDFPAAMPWEETVEQPLTSGPSQVLVTRTAEIDALLAEWNASHGWPPGGDGSGGGDGSATDDDDDEDPSGGGGGGGGGAADDPAAGACACDIEDGRSSPMTAGFAMLALGALFRRRRR